MKKIFSGMLRGSVSSPVPIDAEAFMADISESIEADGIDRTSATKARLHIRTKILRIGYKVDIELIHRRIRYTLDTANITMAVVVSAFLGLLIYRGRIDTYVFWAALISAAILWAINVIIHGRVSGAIKAALPEGQASGTPSETERKNLNTSITQQRRCPACGSFVTDFGSVCADCGIALRPSRESASNLSGYRLKYFYKKNPEND